MLMVAVGMGDVVVPAANQLSARPFFTGRPLCPCDRLEQLTICSRAAHDTESQSPAIDQHMLPYKWGSVEGWLGVGRVVSYLKLGV